VNAVVFLFLFYARAPAGFVVWKNKGKKDLVDREEKTTAFTALSAQHRPPARPGTARSAVHAAISDSPAAVRKRRSRVRRARGRSLLQLDLAYDKLVTALLRASDAAVQAGAAPRLTEAGSYDRSAVAAAAAEVLEEWTKSWL
jgi:hypothetical protein